MRRLATVLAAVVITYHVVYGAKDMGTWTTMEKVQQKNGTYTSTTFDSSSGPGYPTITLTRPMSTTDTNLGASVPEPNVRLAVTTLKNGKSVSVMVCPTARVFNIGTTGDPGTGTTNVTFACMPAGTETAKP